MSDAGTGPSDDTMKWMRCITPKVDNCKDVLEVRQCASDIGNTIMDDEAEWRAMTYMTLLTKIQECLN